MSAARRCHGPFVWGAQLFWGRVVCRRPDVPMPRSVLFCRASVEGRVESSVRTPKAVVVMPAYNAARTLVRTYRDIPPGWSTT
jgi:hypothetical protein